MEQMSDSVPEDARPLSGEVRLRALTRTIVFTADDTRGEKRESQRRERMRAILLRELAARGYDLSSGS